MVTWLMLVNTYLYISRPDNSDDLGIKRDRYTLEIQDSHQLLPANSLARSLYYIYGGAHLTWRLLLVAVPHTLFLKLDGRLLLAHFGRHHSMNRPQYIYQPKYKARL